MVISREDAANEAAFWAQLPGNAALRPRVAAINSRNFAAFAPYHNFPRGRKENNHWGPALTMFKTSAGSPYYFSYHASDPYDPDGGSKKDVGHALILGPSGTGKTALSCFTQTMLEKFDCTRVCFTKDYDAQLCIQANGGIFFPIKQGIPTGFNPFAVDPTPENRTFVYGLLREMLKMPGREFSPTEEEELSRSLGILWNMPQEVRRLARLKDSLRVTQEDGLHKRLRKWVESGEYAWVFDNLQDGMQDIFTTHKYIGFDVTSFLDIPTIRTPINMYLFNWVNRLTDGRRFALYISEFWKILDDPAMEYFAKDQLKTQRKKNAFTVLDSQSPSDVFNSSASRTLIEQTPTKFLLPNPDANKEEYIDGLNCSEREVRIIKEEMEPGSRQFLIKQGRQSVVCELNLKGMYYYLHILSSRTQNIEIAAALQAQFGIEPGQWLPVFRQRVAA
jgi:type IV secretion system protein VirB4